VKVQPRKRGRQKGTTKVDHPNYAKAHRPKGTKKRDPEYRDIEDMLFASFVDYRIAQLTEQDIAAGKKNGMTPLKTAIDHICKEFHRMDIGLLKYYRRGKRLLEEHRADGINFSVSESTPDTLKKVSRNLASTLANIRPDFSMSIINSDSAFEDLVDGLLSGGHPI
jgi:hypothetical protein